MTISAKAKQTTDRLNKFMDQHVYPNNETYHQQIKILAMIDGKLFQ